MDEKIKKMMLFSGMAILPWLTVGIAIAITLNQEFQFPHAVLSELGANGSSTEFFSPAINNFPVGVLFIMFGIGIILSNEGNSTWARFGCFDYHPWNWKYYGRHIFL